MEKIKNNVVVIFCGALITGFAAGWGAHVAMLKDGGLVTITAKKLGELENAAFAGGAALPPKISAMPVQTPSPELGPQSIMADNGAARGKKPEPIEPSEGERLALRAHQVLGEPSGEHWDFIYLNLCSKRGVQQSSIPPEEAKKMQKYIGDWRDHTTTRTFESAPIYLPRSPTQLSSPFQFKGSGDMAEVIYIYLDPTTHRTCIEKIEGMIRDDKKLSLR